MQTAFPFKSRCLSHLSVANARKPSIASRLRYMRLVSSGGGSPYVLKPKHPDFIKIQATRQPFVPSLPITITKSPDPEWKYGKGVQNKTVLEKAHVEIDPAENGRPMIANYKTLVSGIPRPISFVSTKSKEGKRNIAPFSYFQVVDHDPPTFVIGFTARGDRPKDTRKNLEDTGECVINIVSDHMIEAVNATSLDIPYESSEWELSGLYPSPSTTVKPERVKEAVFSIEGKLLEMKSLDYHGHGKSGKPTGALAIIEATRFWVREDAISDTKDEIDLEVLRPLVQLGGIQYGRIREVFELPRPDLRTELANERSGLAQFMEKR
jgi:flavin reductase (DIM6/NTAB) family NADH-FMN oxidoreductase RutF